MTTPISNTSAIQTDEEHEAALLEVESLWNAEPNSPEEARLDLLVTLIEEYEEKHYPIKLPLEPLVDESRKST